MKLPEIPGTTSAEIAIAPDINIYKPVTLLKVAEGENSITEHKQPDINKPITSSLPNFCFKGSINNEQNNKDERKDLKNIGKVEIKDIIKFDNIKIEVIIPNAKTKRKLPSIMAHESLNSSLNNFLKKLLSKELIAIINLL